MELNKTQVEEVINALRGSCSTIDEQLSMRYDVAGIDEFENEMEILLQIDDAIFCCTCCSWWCPIEEETATAQGESEYGCSDCFPEEY